MTGLETRGYRPRPHERGEFQRYMWERIRHDFRRRAWAHEMLYGVPVGPTLSMVNPPRLRGIQTMWGLPLIVSDKLPPGSVGHITLP